MGPPDNSREIRWKPRVIDIAPTETNLASTLLDSGLQVLLLAAPAARTGTTVSAVSLAGQLARASAGKVLLVDASVSASNLSGHFHFPHTDGVLGFFDLLSGRMPVADTLSLIKHVDQAGKPLELLPAGGGGKNAAFSAEAAKQVFAALKAQYRFIVIDSDAIYANRDTLTLAALADGVVVVVSAEQTRWEVAQTMTQRLGHAGAHLIGAIFNRRRYYMPRSVYNRL